jgi:anhydro-N-acetylmuramic acid kinase
MPGSCATGTSPWTRKLPPPKSTGPEYFNLEWLDAALGSLDAAPAQEDVQRTLCELAAMGISESIVRHAAATEEVYVCGGGAHNATLMMSLAERLGPRRVSATTDLGMPPDWMEASAFAWLAHRTLENQPGSLPSVTGAARPVVLGGIYPG